MENARYVMGLDIGSATSKAVVLCGGALAGTGVAPDGAGTGGPARARAAALAAAGIAQSALAKVVATGYGRRHADGANAQKSELTCHAKAAHSLCPAARTVIDVGGQDAKVILLDENGQMASFVMNDKCAAGTGRFLDVMARVLELDAAGLAGAGARAAGCADISSTCTVFAESEVISQLANAVPIADIVAGIHRSVAARVAALAKRAGAVAPVVMTGGVAQNSGVVQALSAELATPVAVVPNPQLAGALGAALLAAEAV